MRSIARSMPRHRKVFDRIFNLLEVSVVSHVSYQLAPASANNLKSTGEPKVDIPSHKTGLRRCHWLSHGHLVLLPPIGDTQLLHPGVKCAGL